MREPQEGPNRPGKSYSIDSVDYCKDVAENSRPAIHLRACRVQQPVLEPGEGISTAFSLNHPLIKTAAASPKKKRQKSDDRAFSLRRHVIHQEDSFCCRVTFKVRSSATQAAVLNN